MGNKTPLVVLNYFLSGNIVIYGLGEVLVFIIGRFMCGVLRLPLQKHITVLNILLSLHNT